MKFLICLRNAPRGALLSTSLPRAVSVVACMKTHSFKKCHTINNHSFNKLKSPVQILSRTFSEFPKHIVVKLPNLSPTMETGTVVSWAKNEGDQVSEGDLLAEIETDKATMSMDSSDEGFIAKILVPAGSKDIPVNTPLCIVVEDSSFVASFKNFTSSDAPNTTSVFSPKTEKPKTVASTASSVKAPKDQESVSINLSRTGNRIFASPFAKRLAKERGLDLTSLGIGSGVMGMIVSANLANAKARMSSDMPIIRRSSDSVVDLPITNMRTVIAKRLLDSKRTVPHYYLTIDINLNSVVALRNQINSKLETSKSNKKISINDFIIKAVSNACLKVPECNSSWMGDVIKRYNVVDVSVAVATSSGLITPILKDAHCKGLLEISENIKELANRARQNKLLPHEFQGGTFTISNLGMFGISNFSAIINPPQACLLAVGGTRQQVVPRIDTDSEAGFNFKISNVVSVTLCCDHRVVDGAIGAQWLSEFKQILEEPAMMLM